MIPALVRRLARVRFLAALASAVLAAPSLAQSIAEPVPGLRLPRNVTPLAYEARLRVDPASDTFRGSIEISVRIAEPTDLVWINAKGLAIGEIRATLPQSPAEPVEGSLVPGSDDVVGLRFAKVLSPGDVKLAIAYAGTVERNGAVALFRQDEGGRPYVVTQFEPLDARRVFPCFDEPDRKATWKLVLTVPAAMRAVANMPVESDRAAGAGWREVAFQRSPPLPSYLVAFAVGEFEVRDAGRWGRNNTPVSIVFPKGRAAEAQYAAANAGPILAAAERYFGEPFPFPKLDLLAYPVSSFGSAMENPGLITFSSRFLLARPDEASPLFQQRFVGIAAHEIAHMWFGDYVTMAWWDDLWLNESFASWLGTRLVRELRPEWPTGWRSRQRSKAIDLDKLATARALRQPIVEPGEIRAAFDGITYAKGETLLAMFEQWLGPQKFREGVRRYVAKHAWGNATADDFFAALAASDDAVVPAFRGFADRGGVPLLDVSLDCAGAPSLKLSQQRFLALGGTPSAGAPWVFPACFDYGDAKRAQQACVLVREATQVVPLPAGSSCPQWVVANRTGVGYYLPRLTPQLYDALPKSERLFPPADYEPLLGDLDVLARGGAVRYDVAMRLVARQASNTDPRAARRAFELAQDVPASLVDPANRVAYAAWIRRHFGERARLLGWLPRAGDSPDVLRLRVSAVTLVAVRGEDVALARKAQQLTQRWLTHRSAIPPESRDVVLQGAVRTSSGPDAARLFDALAEVLAKSRDANERTDVVVAMGGFRDKALFDRALDLAFSPANRLNAPEVMRAALEDDATRSLALKWLAARGAPVLQAYPAESRAALSTWASRACSSIERNDLVAALGGPLAQAEGGARRFHETLERVDACIALRKSQQRAFNEFVATSDR